MVPSQDDEMKDPLFWMLKQTEYVSLLCSFQVATGVPGCLTSYNITVPSPHATTIWSSLASECATSYRASWVSQLKCVRQSLLPKGWSHHIDLHMLCYNTIWSEFCNYQGSIPYETEVLCASESNPAIIKWGELSSKAREACSSKFQQHCGRTKVETESLVIDIYCQMISSV